MKKQIIWLTILFLFCLPWQIQSAQHEPAQIKKFADHLFQQEDYIRAAMEYEKYSYYTNSVSDTILFKIGLCHQFRENYKFASQKFKQIVEQDTSQLQETARLALLYNLYQREAWGQIVELGYENEKEFYFYYHGVMQDTSHLHLKTDINQIEDDSLRQKYINLYQNRQNLAQRSSFVAGFLSLLAPGLGKVYLNRKGDGLFSFVMTSLTAIVAYRSFQTDLLITGIVTGGISLSFYLGTIYGSYIGAKLFNQNAKDLWKSKLEELNPVKRNPYWEKWIKK